MKYPVMFFTASLIAAALAVSYAGAGGRWQSPSAAGRVMTVDRKTITVEGRDELHTIVVIDKTIFTRQVEGKLTDIKKGMRGTVAGKLSEDGNNVEARIIMLDLSRMNRLGSDTPAAFHLRLDGGLSGAFSGKRIVKPSGFTGGEITNTSPLTVKTDDGKSVVVKTTEEMKIRITKNASLTDVEKGEFIVVFGKPGADGVIKAESVQIGGGRGSEAR